jgi:GNAT superfamily N-acetyltransferase
MSAGSANLIGLRVVLRRRAGVRDGRVVYSDVLGQLVGVAGGVLSVRRDDGSTVTVAAEDVHRLRAVPPGRAEIIALEEVAARGWPAPETARLGSWLLRAGEGWTRRANSALLLGEPGMPVPAALDRVRSWYAARALPAVLAIPLPAQAPADHTAARLGWAVDVETEVLAAPITSAPVTPAQVTSAQVTSGPAAAASGPLDPAEPAAGGAGVLLSGTLSPRWEAVYRARTVPAVGRRILTGPATVTFASIELDGTTVAIGRGVVVEDWLGVAAVEVLPGYRRRGLAGRLTGGLLRWGAAHGARRCYVQVEAANAPALGLYASLGFTRHHRYRTRVAPGSR